MKTYTMGEYQMPSDDKPRKDPAINAVWQWLVIKETAGEVLLISCDVIDWEPYYDCNSLQEPAKPATWEMSNIREYLKGIYDTCFSECEKSRILTNETGDHLFLLTAEEVRKFLPTEESRIAMIEWADPNLPEEPYYWWLDTAGTEPGSRQVVMEDGFIFEEGFPNDSDEIGVRPAMRITIDEI